MGIWHQSFTQNNNYQRQIDNLNSTNDEDDILIKLLRRLNSSTPAAAAAAAVISTDTHKYRQKLTIITTTNAQHTHQNFLFHSTSHIIHFHIILIILCAYQSVLVENNFFLSFLFLFGFVSSLNYFQFILRLKFGLHLSVSLPVSLMIFELLLLYHFSFVFCVYACKRIAVSHWKDGSNARKLRGSLEQGDARRCTR